MKNNRIAIITHFNVCNFGANMQALSTYSYLKKQGWNPILVNWANYQALLFTNVPQIQQDEHKNFVFDNLDVSPVLNNEAEIVNYLKDEKLFNIIVGSDAVFGLDTWLDRLSVNRQGIHYRKSSPDKMFPNVFWLDQLQKDETFKIAMMSVSSQNACYPLFKRDMKAGIAKCLKRYDYISVRDSWTQKMVKHICNRDVKVTPDPMWAFEENYNDHETKEAFLKRMNIDKSYILLGFQNVLPEKTASWIGQFMSLAHQSGYKCIPLPFAFGYMPYEYDKQTNFPLSPFDWYKLIKFSNGYVGYNMHPIIVSMANNVPCFSIDNYGINVLKFFNIAKSSKIYDIFRMVGRLDCRCSLRDFFHTSKYTPSYVLNKLMNYDFSSGELFAKEQKDNYRVMMSNILKIFKNEF